MKNIMILMRPKHWIKNFLIFVPAFFSGKLCELDVIKNLVLGFACFSLVSSIVYIFNDLKDIEKDRLHEEKCKRPLASKAVSIKTAEITILFLGTGTIILGCLMKNRQSYIPVFWCVFYLILNMAYSTGLKNIPIVDVGILAAGFIIRILYGAAVSNIAVSAWLCLTVMAFALYMGIGKRRNELGMGGGTARIVLQYYNVELLDKYMTITATIGIVFYSLWAGFVISNSLVMWTVPIVLFIIMKYEMIIRGNSYGDPVEVLLSDRVLVGLVGLYVCSMILLMYVL